MKNYKCLSGAVLKNIALITMVIDHFNKAIVSSRLYDPLPWYLVGLVQLMAILGRLAFPIFCFLLVEGFDHTHSKIRYLRNLLLFAVISEIPFNLYVNATFLFPHGQSIFFTLSIAFSVIWGIDECRKRIENWPLPAMAITIAGCWIAGELGVDYDFYGVLVPLILYLLREKPFLASIAAFVPILKTPWALLGFVLTNFYNGERGRQIKWLNYWIYPAHLLVLGLIRYFTF